MTLQQLVYFCAIARQKNFTKASEEVYVAQSSLSHAISNLENELGVKLFFRSTGKEVELTNYGEILLPLAEDIIARVEDAKEQILAAAHPAGGKVTILFSDMSGLGFITQLFNAFSDEDDHKDINIVFEHVSVCDRVPEMLRTGDADFIISASTYTPDVETVPFARQPLYVMVSENHPLADREYVTVDDIKDEMILQYKKNTTIQKQIEHLFNEHGIAPRYFMSFDQWNVMVANVAVGKGIMITPMLSEEKVVKYIPLEAKHAFRDMNISYCRDKKLSWAAQEVLDFCLEYETD